MKLLIIKNKIFKKKIIKKEILGEIICILVLSFFVFLSARALFKPGFFRTIDDITIVRIIYLKKELLRGEWFNNFPVRWSAELSYNYGYPLYLFYSPLVYYVGAILMIIGKISHIVATKWVYVFPLIIGPYLFYATARIKLNKFSSLIAACFYTLFPFRGYDTYIRGGVGEAWAMAFLPAIIGGLFLIERNKTVGGLIVSFFFFLVIISHNLSAVQIFFLLLLFILFFLLKNKKSWLFLILGIGMATFFWLPSIFYLPLVRVFYSPQNTGEIFNFLIPISELIKLRFNFFSEDRFSSLFFYFLILGLVFFILKIKNMNSKEKKEISFWMILGFFLYFLLSNVSYYFWKVTLPFSRMLQFPWRVLVLLSFILPFLIGLTLDLIKNKILKIIIGLLFVLSFLIFLPAFKPKEYSFFYEYRAEDSGPCATSWGEEYIPVWVKECPGFYPKEDIEIKGEGNLEILRNNLINIEAVVKMKEEGDLVVNKYYFPGWQVVIDGKRYVPDYQFSGWGIFKVKIPAGTHNVKVLFSKTKIMWLSDIISIISFLIFGFYLVRLILFLRKK